MLQLKNYSIRNVQKIHLFVNNPTLVIIITRLRDYIKTWINQTNTYHEYANTHDTGSSTWALAKTFLYEDGVSSEMRLPLISYVGVDYHQNDCHLGNVQTPSSWASLNNSRWINTKKCTELASELIIFLLLLVSYNFSLVHFKICRWYSFQRLGALS